MITVAALLLIVLISATFVRAGALALAYTGLAKEVANFQALSAFLGVGFTTSESERITTHPVRRRIVRTLMVLGYFGLGSGLVSVITVVMQAQAGEGAMKLLITVTGAAAILALFGGKVFDPVIQRGVRKAMGKRTGPLIHDYAELLRVDKGYSISNVHVVTGGWLEGRSLRQLRLTDEGVLVLSIARAGGVTLATPGPDTVLAAGDVLLAYGLEEDLVDLASRGAGEAGESAHAAATRVHHGRTTIEESEDERAHCAPPESAPDA